MNGHVFVVHGDLNRLHCDAILIPTDSRFHVTDKFGRNLVRGPDGFVETDPWANDERARRMGNSEGPQIWLGRIAVEQDFADEDAASEWFATGIRAFVGGALAVLDEPGRGRPPLLGINLVGTGEGGAHLRRGLVLDALLRELQSICTMTVVDIALVCFDDKAYAAAQRAREHAFARGDDGGGEDGEGGAGNWDFAERTTTLHEHAERLASHTRAGRLSLFLGAGVSAGAGIPSWQELLDGLNDGLGTGQVEASRAHFLDPRDFASLLERRYNDASDGPSFAESVAGMLQSGRHSIQHGLLAALPVDEVVTTNFDSLFELAATSGGRGLSVLPADPQPEPDRWLLKIHGSVEHPDTLVFTRAAYLEAPRERGALFGLVQAMLLTRHMLFVGYSLRDEDFHEVIHDVRRALPTSVRDDQLGTALTLFDDELHSELWTDDVEIVAVRAAPDGAPTDADIAAAGRDVERFLDLVGFLVTDLARFVLDPTYNDMLDSDEQRLATALTSLNIDVDPNDDRPGWREVNDLLNRLGRPLAKARTDRLGWDHPALQVDSDPLMRRRYRSLQSWYRHHVLGAQHGDRDGGAPVGSMLANGDVERDRALNFLNDPGILRYVDERVPHVIACGGTLDEHRLRHNMLSSMPMAFSLVAAIRDAPDNAEIVSRLFGVDANEIITDADPTVADGCQCFPRVTHAEWSPKPALHLGDRTAFDAAIWYRTSHQALGVIGIETKYTEPLSQKEYDTPRYREVTDRCAWFAPSAADDLRGRATNQLWRNTMLAASLETTPDPCGQAEVAHLAVIGLECDTSLWVAARSLQTHMVTPERVIPRTLEAVVACFGGTDVDGRPADNSPTSLARFAATFNQRYLDTGPMGTPS